MFTHISAADLEQNLLKLIGHIKYDGNTGKPLPITDMVEIPRGALVRLLNILAQQNAAYEVTTYELCQHFIPNNHRPFFPEPVTIAAKVT
jgi:hypothetical protein